MPITIHQIIERITPRKTLKRRQVDRYIKTLGIKWAGAATKPQLWPDNTPDLILAHLGLDTPPGATGILSVADAKRLAKAKRGAK